MLFKILGVILFVLSIYAIVKIGQSDEPPMGKAIWIAMVLLVPLLGLMAWYVAGPGGARMIRI